MYYLVGYGDAGYDANYLAYIGIEWESLSNFKWNRIKGYGGSANPLNCFAWNEI